MATTGQVASLEGHIETSIGLFRKEFHKDPDFVSAAPGRINIIGDHTDYNFGLCMPAAIDRWVLTVFKKRQDAAINIKSVSFNSSMNFSVNTITDTSESWKKYVYGAIEIFKSTTPLNEGFDALIWGNVPLGSGVSSSAAIEVSFMNGLRAMYEANIDDLHIVKLCQRVEHEFLHLKSGLLDQYASQFSRQGRVMVLDMHTLQHQYVKMEAEDLEWVLVESGVSRELAGSGYSQRVKETSEAFVFLQEQKPEIRSFRDIKEDYLELLPNEIWKKRLGHYISENRRVIDAMNNIQNKDYVALGKVLNDSHKSLSELYESSCKELDYLAAEAQKFEGCFGSRIMGGGFGGCTLNLMRKEALPEFTGYIKRSYLEKYNKEAAVEHFTLVEGAAIHKHY